MGKIKLTGYLNRIEAKYTNYLEKWKKLEEKMTEEEERHKAVDLKYLNREGVEHEKEMHKATRKKILAEFENVRQQFSSDVDNIIVDADKLFNRHFRYNPADVDENGVYILANTSMSIDELIEFAESYKERGNMTMYYMASEKLKTEKKEWELTDSERRGAAYYETAKRLRTIRPDHEVLEGFKEVCMYSLGHTSFFSDNDYALSGVRVVQKKHDEFYQSYRQASEEIETEAPTPWE